MKKLVLICLMAISTFVFAEDIGPITGDKVVSLNGRFIRTGGLDYALSKSGIEQKYKNLDKEQQKKILDQYILRQLMKDEAYRVSSDDKDFQNEIYYLIREYALEFWEKKEKSKMIITLDEVKKYFESNKDRFKDLNMTSVESVAIIEEAIKTDKIRSKYQDIAQKLKDKATITYFDK